MPAQTPVCASRRTATETCGIALCANLLPNALAAKRAIADTLGMPLARLSPDEHAFIDAVLAETLEKQQVLSRVRERFCAGRHRSQGDPPPC